MDVISPMPPGVNEQIAVALSSLAIFAVRNAIPTLAPSSTKAISIVGTIAEPSTSSVCRLSDEPMAVPSKARPAKFTLRGIAAERPEMRLVAPTAISAPTIAPAGMRNHTAANPPAAAIGAMSHSGSMPGCGLIVARRTLKRSAPTRASGESPLDLDVVVKADDAIPFFEWRHEIAIVPRVAIATQAGKTRLYRLDHCVARNARIGRHGQAHLGELVGIQVARFTALVHHNSERTVNTSGGGSDIRGAFRAHNHGGIGSRPEV